MSATINGPVVVTGGAAGIGRAAALACAERGAAVAILDLDEAAADEAAAGAHESGAPDAIGLGCDVRDEDYRRRGDPRRIPSGSDRPGGWLPAPGSSAAGSSTRSRPRPGARSSTPTSTAPSTPASTRSRGWSSTARAARSSAPPPRSRRSARPGGASAYSASKGAISSLVRSLALDYAPHSIRVNAIVPGATQTALMWAGVPEVDVPAARERTSEQLALGRLAEPAEIAAGIAWLLSDQASYMTGSHLVIDGGLLARASIDE